MKNKGLEGQSLQNYLNNGVENIIKGAMRAALSNPKESAFMARYAVVSKMASKLRRESEKKGEHIPPFLIASITEMCNLYCKGCYARANQIDCSEERQEELTASEWLNIFNEARQMGISFILLAGGEPMLRLDVIEKAGSISEILFPVFTNGTLISEEALTLFDKYRNLIPILSIEGDMYYTDNRRGTGTYEKVNHGIKTLKSRKILYGTSITLTTENIYEVTSDNFLEQLKEEGCKAVIYVEYVPVSTQTQDLTPTEIERLYLIHRLKELRRGNEDMLFIAFPGDEKLLGGCLAAGRGFFHINAKGAAQPCPFSPYSDTNLKNTNLKQALNSPFFKNLRDSKLLTTPHPGGCVLFDQSEKVEEFQKKGLPTFV